MPELPEVETIARRLEPELVGRRILDADVLWQRTLATPSLDEFKAQIQGQKILAVTRRAKYFIMNLSDASLLIHLRMSGDLEVKSSTAQPLKHDRVILKLSGRKSLFFNDTRKFGRVWLVNQPDEVLGRLGPEPFSKDFTAQWLYQALQGKNRQLKPLLLDQTFLAGLGNIYTDEALHLARLHPLTASNAITPEQAGELRKAVRSVLRKGIRRHGASIDWMYRGGEYQNYFRVYDREGQACANCGTPIQRMIVGQRSTHFCPNCQAEVAHD